MDAPRPLTPRQREVLVLYGTGLTQIEIGRALGVTDRAVEAHLGCARERMNTRSTVVCMLRAIASGELGFDGNTAKLFVPSSDFLEQRGAT